MRYWRDTNQAAFVAEVWQLDTIPPRLAELSTKGAWVEAEVAKHPKTPPETLERLSQHGKVLTWLGLLQNPALPVSCFEALDKREEASIRRALAICERTPAPLRERLSKLEAREVLQAVARSPKTAPQTLERLSRSKFSEVYRAALKNPNNPLYMEGSPWQRFPQSSYNIARGRALPGLLLERFSRSANARELQLAARCPELTIEQLERLASHETIAVRATIARHPKLTERAARLLARDESPFVSNALASNPAALALLPSLTKKRR